MGFLYICFMRKKKIFSMLLLGCALALQAQFTVKVQMPTGFQAPQAYLYAYNGSQELIEANGTTQGNTWVFKVTQPYHGLLKVYFPENDQAFMVVSENSDVAATVSLQGDKIANVTFADKANQVFNQYQDTHAQKTQILPVLLQMQSFYRPDSDFGSAMSKEIARLKATQTDNVSQYPFISFYTGPLKDYISGNTQLTPEDYQNFIANAPLYLEHSAQIRPVLVNYLRKFDQSKYSQAVDALLKKLDVESMRGQMVLSEFIDIFDMYALKDLHTKYLSEAKNLTCTISDRLEKSIKNSERVAIGATMENYKFTNPLHTKAKSIYDVKAKMKIIMFWSSTCSHCEAQLPEIIKNYKYLKSKGVEVIGLSVDSDAASYLNRAKALPWINDSELKGWDSSVSDKYNIHATPSYFVLDTNNKIVAKPRNFAETLAYIKSH